MDKDIERRIEFLKRTESHERRLYSRYPEQFALAFRGPTRSMLLDATDPRFWEVFSVVLYRLRPEKALEEEDLGELLVGYLEFEHERDGKSVMKAARAVAKREPRFPLLALTWTLDSLAETVCLHRILSLRLDPREALDIRALLEIAGIFPVEEPENRPFHLLDPAFHLDMLALLQERLASMVRWLLSPLSDAHLVGLTKTEILKAVGGLIPLTVSQRGYTRAKKDVMGFVRVMEAHVEFWLSQIGDGNCSNEPRPPQVVVDTKDYKILLDGIDVTLKFSKGLRGLVFLCANEKNDAGMGFISKERVVDSGTRQSKAIDIYRVFQRRCRSAKALMNADHLLLCKDGQIWFAPNVKVKNREAGIARNISLSMAEEMKARKYRRHR